MKTNLDLSVIVCTRNRAEQLRVALKHWKRVTINSHWELILVNNASTDHTDAIIAEFLNSELPLVPTFCQSRGLGCAREHGRKLARGKLIIFTDDDCYPAQHYLADWRKVFDNYPDVAVFGGRILLWDETDAKVTVDYREAPASYKSGAFPAPGSFQGANFAVRAEALERIGGFDVNMGAGTPFPCEDIDVACRILQSGHPGLFHPAPTIFHHHRRKASDVPMLALSYAKGRGAYYMRFALERKTSTAALRAWYWASRNIMKHAISRGGGAQLRLWASECFSAVRYATSGCYLRRPRPPHRAAAQSIPLPLD